MAVPTVFQAMWPKSDRVNDVKNEIVQTLQKLESTTYGL